MKEQQPPPDHKEWIDPADIEYQKKVLIAELEFAQAIAERCEHDIRCSECGWVVPMLAAVGEETP